MRDGVILSPRSTQPQIAPTIDPASPFARGLAFFAPMSPADPTRDLVSGIRATTTGAVNVVATRSGQVLREFGTSKYLDFNRKPKGIGTTTPVTIAWTQEARATSAYSTVLALQVGTPGANRGFAIFQSAADAGYYFTAGPRDAGSAQSWSGALGALTDNVLDSFVLTTAGGLESFTASDWTLYRNGQVVTRGTTTGFSNNLADAFRVGALEDALHPFEGGIGNLGIWSRVFTPSEAFSWSKNQNQLFPPQQRRIWIPVSAAGGVSLTPGVSALALNSFEPTLTQTTNSSLVPGVAGLTLATFAPTVTQSSASTLVPGVAALSLDTFAPSLVQTTNSSLAPGVAGLTVVTFTPSVGQTSGLTLSPGTATLSLLTFAPTLSQTGAVNLSPAAAALVLSVYAPGLVVSGQDLDEMYPLGGYTQDLPLSGLSQTYPLSGQIQG